MLVGTSGTRQASDASVIATNDDAFMCKVAAVKRQYFADDFLLAIAEASGLGLDPFSVRRPPIINRGTFARVRVVQRIVELFLQGVSKGGNAQIISLGAGYDTLPFRLMERELDVAVSYVEVDFPSVTRAKHEIVNNVSRICNLFENLTVLKGGLGISGPRLKSVSGNPFHYILYPCDLRDVSEFAASLEACGVSFSKPTLFLTECVLMYMTPGHSDALLRYTTSRFTGQRCFVNYEPIKPADPFGKQMVANIAARGSPLLGIEAYPDVAAQKERFRNTGWANVDALDMLQAFDNMFSQQERFALNRIEPLDEMEEWNLIMSHYTIVFARSGKAMATHPMFCDST